jgi:hypothetical protein
MNVQAKATKGFILGLLILLAGAPLGCKKAAPSGGADASQFLSAAPEAKAAWEGALEAAKTNAPEAFAVLRGLRQQPGLTPAQQDAIDAQFRTIIQDLTAAKEKGDTNAARALLEIRRASRGRRN